MSNHKVPAKLQSMIDVLADYARRYPAEVIAMYEHRRDEDTIHLGNSDVYNNPLGVMHAMIDAAFPKWVSAIVYGPDGSLIGARAIHSDDLKPLGE